MITQSYTAVDFTFPAGAMWMENSKLDEIATSVYGRKYIGQQTGDMFANESVHMVDVSDGEWQANVEDSWNTWLKANQSGAKTLIAKWLALPEGKFDFEIYRQAPEPWMIMSDLVSRGVIPAGIYYIYVYW